MSKRLLFTIALCLFALVQMSAKPHNETIDGFNYFIDTDAKEATLLKGYNSWDVKIPSSVTTADGIVCSVVALGDECFRECQISSVEIPNTVTSLGNSCFEDCVSITSIVIPSSVTSLGNSCFASCDNLTSIVIPSSVTSLGNYCFSYCSSLTSIEIPSSVTSLGNSCFMHCSSLTNIEIPSSVTSLSYNCFSDCTNLTSIKIPSSVTSLESYCFYKCSSLTSIEIPSLGTSLGDHCFDGCTNLAEIKCFAEKIPDASADAFYGLSTSTCILYVPKQSLNTYKADAEWGQFKYIYPLDESETGTGSEKCEKPEISYTNGALDFKSSTPEAEYHYTIADADITTDTYDEDGHVELVAAYDITAYATADGYQPSDLAKAKLLWLDGSLDDTPSNIIQVAKRGVVAKAEGGFVAISGLKDGERVTFSTVDGKVIGTATAANGTVGFSTTEKIVVAKIGSQSVKLAME